MAQPYSLSDSALNLPHPTFPRRTFAAALDRVPVGAGEGAGEDDATVLLSKLQGIIFQWKVGKHRFYWFLDENS